MPFFGELKRRGVVRVAVAYLAGAWALAQIADIVVPAYGLPEAWLGLLITILAVGLVPVVITTWLFELTPEGLRRDTGDRPEPAVSHRTIDRIIMILLALAVGFFALDKFAFEPGRDAELADRIRADALIESYGDRSIAVLPFENMTGEHDQAFFADGIAEEILNLLAKIRDLRVISRSTSFNYRGDVNLQQVAEDLGVTYLLEGSVRRAGGTYRITAQLIHGRTDAHVWSETFDRSSDDIFAIQDELAEAVAGALKVHLDRDGLRRYETDPETYALFLRARHIFRGYSPTDQDRTVPIRMLRTALERDPEFVPAMLELSNILWYESRYAEHSAEQAALEQERNSLVQRALSIAPDDGVVNAYMSYRSLAREHDAQMAARYIQRALELDPVHQEVLRVAGFMADVLNLEVDRIELASRTLSRDVLCVQCLDLLAEAYDDIGETDKAREVRQRRIDLVGDEAANYQLAYSQMDADPATALAFFQSQPDEHGVDPLGPQVELLVKLGRRDEALQVQQRLLEEWGDKAAFWVAVGFAQLGEVEKAWEWLLRALAIDPELFLFIYEGEDFPGLRDTQRWKDLRHKMGVSEEQLAAVKFEMPKLGPK